MKIFGYSMTRNYAPDGSCVRCPHCGSTYFLEEVKAEVSGHAAEIDTNCRGCGETVAFWAYGSYNPSDRLFDKSVPAMVKRVGLRLVGRL